MQYNCQSNSVGCRKSLAGNVSNQVYGNSQPIIYSIIIIKPEFGKALNVQACFVLTLSIALTLVMDMRYPYSWLGIILFCFSNAW
jgi:hypothetical protein